MEHNFEEINYAEEEEDEEEEEYEYEEEPVEIIDDEL